MHFSTVSALLFANGVLASAPHNCLASHGAAVAEFTNCANREALASCLSELKEVQLDQMEACYINAGCPEDHADVEARHALERCQKVAQIAELRKRYAPLQDRADEDNKGTTQAFTGTNCFSTSVFPTSFCPLETEKGGKVKTLACTDIQGTSSACSSGWLCSTDSNGGDICMVAHNNLDVGGIIIAIVLGAATVIGFAFLTFLCCRESRQHKRIAAQAEAQALVRAATKKKRAQEVRAPLMQQQDAAGDPFHDQNQS